MKMSLFAPLVLIVSLSFAQWFCLERATTYVQIDDAASEEVLALPSKFARVVSLEFDGLLSDQMFLRALVFIGKAFERRSVMLENGLRKIDNLLSDSQWEWFVAQLDATTALDPWFLDPYYVGNVNLVWEGHRFQEANNLLDRGIEARNWDWLLPFNAGFNAFYFMHDSVKGSEYLMKAAERPGAPPLLATLAARLAYEGRHTGTAVIFLRQLLRDAKEDDANTVLIRERLKALEGVYAIEQAIDSYRKTYGRLPSKIDDLVTTGYLKQIPSDPYQGTFYLDASGQVKSTSDFGKKGREG